MGENMAQERTPMLAKQLMDEFNGIVTPKDEHKLELSHLLNEGGTSFVFRGSRDFGGHKQDVVVKLFKFIDEMTSPRAKEYAEKHDILDGEECGLLAAQHSQYVVQLLGAGHLRRRPNRGNLQERPYLVLQYIEPQQFNNLEEFLMAKVEAKTIPKACDSLPLMSQITSAVRSVKKYVLNHRDLKPANIIFGPSERIFLCDFQTAVKGDDLGCYEGASFGSSVYSSPEEIRNAVRKSGKGISHYDPNMADNDLEKVTNTADLYSLGLVFVRVSNPTITISRFPDEGAKCDVARFYKVIDGIVADVPDYCKSLCARCITYSPEHGHNYDLNPVNLRHIPRPDRFESIDELIQHLRVAMVLVRPYHSR
jgi:serine/threonine protein kinase